MPYLHLPRPRRAGGLIHPTSLIQPLNVADAAVFLPGYSTISIPSGRLRMTTQIGRGNTPEGPASSVSSSAVAFLPSSTRLKSQTEGTVVGIYRPNYYWGSCAFALSQYWRYSAAGFDFYNGEINAWFSNTRHAISAFSGDPTGTLIYWAMSRVGDDFRCAWRAASGESGFTVTTVASSWFGYMTWGGSNEVFGVNADYDAGSAAECNGELVLAAIIPDVVLPDEELMRLRNDPWAIFK
jgi:hypothetical protein